MSKYQPATEAALAELVASYRDDPYGFVMAVFPWGEPTLPDGSFSPLAHKSGPEAWQARILKDMGEHIRENDTLASIGLDMAVWFSAVASGHGVGKSALVTWIIYFLMSTRRDTRGVVTASTAAQLEDKTWPELAKWHGLALNKHWFTWTSTQFYFALYPEEKRKNYMVTAMTVSAEKTEAFAGLHNEGGTVFVIFDEASGVLSNVWEVASGALTDGEGFFFAFGNPTRPDGDFADCFEKYSHIYKTYRVDSREVSHTNKLALQAIIDKYGENSDEAKVRVYGQFPVNKYNGFINKDVVDGAIAREYQPDAGAGLIMAIDVARFGDDETVIRFRQGRDARSRKKYKFHGLDTVRVAEKAMELADEYRPDVIVVESTGPGAGVIDILRSRSYKVVEVHPGSQAVDFKSYGNLRAELWSKMRDWLRDEGCIPNDQELAKQLVDIMYYYDAKGEQKLYMEKKADMKKRGLPSPDDADSLMLTFAVRVARRDLRPGMLNRGRRAKGVDYAVLG